MSKTKTKSAATQSENSVSPDKLDLSMGRLKPHFLNNVFTSIYYLCDSDPERAKSINTALSRYLIGTLETIKVEHPIAFEHELDMIRNYLTLEETRLGDKLSVVYDVDITDFNIPPLSVLLPVEIAVKKGISEMNKPGDIRISTRLLAGSYVQIKVSTNAECVSDVVSKSDECKRDLAFVRQLIKETVGGDFDYEDEDGRKSVVIKLPPQSE